MGIMKSILSFILGCIALLLFYNFVSIPLIPILSIYIASFLFLTNNGLRTRRILIFILGCMAIYLYGANIYGSIIYYPKFLNILGIIFEFINIFGFISATSLGIISITKELQYQSENYIN